MKLFEILVPCQTNEGKPIRMRQHREWDRRVRRITGGLTIVSIAKGPYVSPSDELFADRMIPVRITATYSQMETIADMTARFYHQEAVMFYELSSNMTIKKYPENAIKEKTWQDGLYKTMIKNDRPNATVPFTGNQTDNPDTKLKGKL